MRHSTVARDLPGQMVFYECELPAALVADFSSSEVRSNLKPRKERLHRTFRDGLPVAYERLDNPSRRQLAFSFQAE